MAGRATGAAEEVAGKAVVEEGVEGMEEAARGLGEEAETVEMGAALVAWAVTAAVGCIQRKEGAG